MTDYEKKFGFVTYEGKDYIIKEQMRPSGINTEDNSISLSAHAMDDLGREYLVHWKVKTTELEFFDYGKVDSIESLYVFRGQQMSKEDYMKKCEDYYHDRVKNGGGFMTTLCDLISKCDFENSDKLHTVYPELVDGYAVFTNKKLLCEMSRPNW